MTDNLPSAFSFKIRLFNIDQEYKHWRERLAQSELMYSQALFKTAKSLNMGDPRIPDLKHDLIKCSVCHKLIESPDIEECEFCNEDVCDDCWDKHRCEPYDYAEVL